MKNIILIIAVVVTTMTSCSSFTACLESLSYVPKEEKTLDSFGQLTYSVTIDCEGMSKEEIYKRANSYFVYNYGSGKSVIQQQDKEEGILIGKGYKKKVFTLLSDYYDAWHILRIDIKDGKARISVTAGELTWNYETKSGSSSYWKEKNYTLNSVMNVDVYGLSKNGRACLFLSMISSYKDILEEVEKALKEGNTKIDNSDW